MHWPKGKLILEDGSCYNGFSFGYFQTTSGEVVFNTGMVGYPESLTDPSYRGQILVFTYPLIGNYGVPIRKKENGIIKNFESDRIHLAGLVVADYSFHYSHYQARQSLSEWLAKEKIPALFGIDTRALTKKLRRYGVMLGKIVFADENKEIEFMDPNKRMLAAEVSIPKPITYGKGTKKVIVIDLGVKNNILRSLLKRKIKVVRVPFDYDLSKEEFDGVLISNGPGDPQKYQRTILNIRRIFKKNKPIFGICLGNQLLALAAGGRTYKLKYGHRSQNQPCILVRTKRCFITSQNHGFAVEENSLNSSWQTWFYNLNDRTNEGIRHKNKPWMSVQFHPEATPGPTDTDFLFDEFIKLL